MLNGDFFGNWTNFFLLRTIRRKATARPAGQTAVLLPEGHEKPQLSAPIPVLDSCRGESHGPDPADTPAI
jgi:hypothetical protein